MSILIILSLTKIRNKIVTVIIFNHLGKRFLLLLLKMLHL